MNLFGLEEMILLCFVIHFHLHLVTLWKSVVEIMSLVM